MRRILSTAFAASLFMISAHYLGWTKFRCWIPSSLAAAVPVASDEKTRLEAAEAAAPLRVNFQDWQLFCSKKTGQERYENCTISQQILDRRTHKQVVRMSFQPLDHQVRGLLLLPFGLDLQKGLELTLSTDPTGQIYPYTTCRADGCVVPLDFDEEQMKNALQATQAHMSFQLLNGREITLPLALHGFSEAWEKALSLTGNSKNNSPAP